MFSFLYLNNRVADVGLRNLNLLLGLENRVKYTVVEVLNGDYNLSRSGSDAFIRYQNRCRNGEHLGTYVGCNGVVWCCDIGLGSVASPPESISGEIIVPEVQIAYQSCKVPSPSSVKFSGFSAFDMKLLVLIDIDES